MKKGLETMGQFARWITPVFVTIAIFMLNDIRNRLDRFEPLIAKVAVLETKVAALEEHK